MKKKLITLMLTTALALGCSVQAFAATSADTSKQITSSSAEQNKLVSNDTTKTNAKVPVKASKIIYGFNYGPNGGPSADSVVANGGIIQIGDVGLAVRDVQEALVFKGYLSQNDVDGYFGQITKNAVLTYQTNMNRAGINLTVDGMVGSQTWRWLRIYL